jgi:hypothetical protein
MADWIPDQFRLAGGVNEEDPAFTLPSGALLFSRNYECLAGGGYRRVAGYEIFDGHVAKPSLATYSVLPFASGGPTPIVDGQTLTGGTSAATAIVVGETEIASGSFSAATAAGNIGVTKVVGIFVSGETVKVGGVVVATLTGAIQTSSIDDASAKSWKRGARNYYRSLIAAPTGEDGILGGFVIDGDVYCFRNAVGGATAVMLKATTAGWSAVTLTGFIRYDDGTGEIFEGDTITGGTSGATAVVRRVSIGAGNVTGPTYASGRLAVTNISGTFQNNEELRVGGVKKALANGTTTAASTFDPDGRFQVVTHNFYGATNQRRAYGVDGANRAWEFNGTYFMFIETGMTTDTPDAIEVHRNHLFLGFPGGSLQNSATGVPTIWSPRLGAAEIGIGDDITGLLTNGNDTLAIAAKNSVSVLRGTSDLDWNLRLISDSIGAAQYTMRESGAQTLFKDRAAIHVITGATPVADAGVNALSRNIRKALESNSKNGIDALFALHDVTKEQYRLFFEDKSGMVATFYGTKLMGWMYTKYEHQFVCAWSGEDDYGVERMYAGTDAGKVMELDMGTSFDGEEIESIVQLPYNYKRAPSRDKRFRLLTLELETPLPITLRVVNDFDYGGTQSSQYLSESSATGGRWDVSSWESFLWDSPVLSATSINIDGVAKNIATTVYHSDDVDDPFTLQAMLVQFSLWGIRRG